MPSAPADREVLERWLSERRAGKVAIVVPERGAKRRLCQVVSQNAREAFTQHRLRRSSDQRGLGARDVWRAWRQPWLGWVSLGRSVVAPDQELFWNRAIGPKRTGRGLKVPLVSFKALKTRFGCTVNDAILAVVAEGLHDWFVARGDRVPERIRVFCPVSVRDPSQRSRLGNRISGMVVELPTGEMEIAGRLQRISYSTAELKRSGQAVAADRLAALVDLCVSKLE